MSAFLHLVAKLVSALAFLALIAWLGYRVYQRSEDRPRLVFRWVLTLVDLGFVALVIGPMFREFGYVAAFVGVPMAAVAGLVLAILWVPDLTDFVGRQFGQLYDGGGRMSDPEPLFSIAEARRKQGRYAEAEEEIRRQLERFPDHFQVQMFLAEIQASDRHDLAAASATIEALLAQPAHTPKNIAFALVRLAEWQLKFTGDREAARATLERIVQLLPDSPEAHMARQRIAHLTPVRMLQEAEQRPRLEVPKSDDRLGLRGESPKIRRADSDPEELAARLVAQLDQFPEDNQSREELAVLYYEGFQRPDLAVEQLEQLIAQPLASPAQIAKWLNLAADFHLGTAGNVTAATAALQRIIDRDPTAPAAEAARRRLTLIGRQAQAKKPSQVLRLGSPPPPSESGDPPPP